MKNEIRDEASRLANLIRSKYNLPVEGPVPVERLATDLGIKISRRDLLGGAEAVAKIDSSVPEIVVDPGTKRVRERFTIAHEIAHFLIESPNVSSVPTPDVSGLSNQETEGFCHEFAAKLLVPDTAIQDISRWSNFSIRQVASRGRGDLDVAVEPTLRRVLELAKGDGGLFIFDRIDGVNKERPFELERGHFPSSDINTPNDMRLRIPYKSDTFDPLLRAYEEGTEYLIYDMSFNLDPIPGKSKTRTAVRAKSYNDKLLLVLIPPAISKSKLRTADSVTWNRRSV